MTVSTRRLVDIRDSIPRHPTRKWKVRDNADTIVIHTSASNNQNPKKTATFHITPGPQNKISSKGASSIAYHDFITKDGTVYHCNDYSDWTWHCGIWNKRSIGVVMAFRGQDPLPEGGWEKPTIKQYTALEEHLTILCLYMTILPQRIFGHREVPGMYTILGNGSKVYRKVCPGLGVNLNTLRYDVAGRLQRRLAAENLYHGAPDSIFGEKSIKALRDFRKKIGNK